MAPPPTSEEAARLLVDTILAQHLLEGSISRKDPRERLADYQKFQAQLLAQESNPSERAKLAVIRLNSAREVVSPIVGDCPLSASITVKIL
jgi:hypothetical protein